MLNAPFILRFCAKVIFFASDYPTVTGAFSQRRYQASAKKNALILIPHGNLFLSPVFVHVYDVMRGTYVSVTP